MENEYYIPTIDEFIQGFKFEVLIHKKGDKLGSIFYLDEEINKELGKSFFAEEDSWSEMCVYWKREPEIKTTIYNGITTTCKECPEYDWAPWINPGYIEELISKGKIRCRYD